MNADPDGDGLFNYQEIELGTDPQKKDTDNDGLDDGLEVDSGTSPVDYDTDNDGLDDGTEINIGTSPVDFDTDGDGLGDGVENEKSTNPLDIDTDDDGLEDGFEVNSFGSDPTVADTDQDRLSDKEEQDYGTDPLSVDSDGDEETDYNEIFVRHTDPLSPDVNFMLTLRDEETNSRVSNVRLYMDGTEIGTTTEQGTIMCEVISIGQHRISISYSGYGNLDVGYITVNPDTTSLDLFVDMPNPVLTVSLTMDTWLKFAIPPDEVGKATVTVGNQGDLASKDTMALITVYDIEDENVLDQDLIRLGSISVGEIADEKSNELDTSYWHDEYVLVVLFDGSDYLPEKDLRSMIDAQGSILDDLVYAVTDYVQENPEVIGKIIDVLLVIL